MCNEQTQTSRINYRDRSRQKANDDNEPSPAILMDKLNTHYNRSASTNVGAKKKIAPKKTAVTSKTLANKSNRRSTSKSTTVSSMKQSKTTEPGLNTATLYAQLRKVDTVIHGLVASSMQLTIESRELKAEHSRDKLDAYERSQAQRETTNKSSPVISKTTNTTKTTKNLEADKIAQLQRDLDKANDEIAARDATVREQDAELRRLKTEINKLKAKAAAVAAAQETEATVTRVAKLKKKADAAAQSAVAAEGGPKRRRRAAAPTSLIDTPPPLTRFQAPPTKTAMVAAETAETLGTNKDKTSSNAMPSQSFSTTPFLSRKRREPSTDVNKESSPSISSRHTATTTTTPNPAINTSGVENKRGKKAPRSFSLFDDDMSADLRTTSTTKPTRRATKRASSNKAASPLKSQPAPRKKRRKLHTSTKLRLYEDDTDEDEEKRNENDNYDNNKTISKDSNDNSSNSKLDGPKLGAPGTSSSFGSFPGGRQISPLKLRNRGLSFKV